MYIVGYVQENRTSLTLPLPSTKSGWDNYLFFPSTNKWQFHIAFEELGGGGEEEHEFHQSEELKKNVEFYISLNDKRILVTKRYINLLYSLLIFKLWIYFLQSCISLYWFLFWSTQGQGK